MIQFDRHIFLIGLKPPTRCWMADRATWQRLWRDMLSLYCGVAPWHPCVAAASKWFTGTQCYFIDFCGGSFAARLGNTTSDFPYWSWHITGQKWRVAIGTLRTLMMRQVRANVTHGCEASAELSSPEFKQVEEWIAQGVVFPSLRPSGLAWNCVMSSWML